MPAVLCAHVGSVCHLCVCIPPVVTIALQATLQPYAIMYCMLYTVGYPIFIARLLFTNKMTIMEDQLLTTKGTPCACGCVCVRVRVWLCFFVSV